MAEWEARQGSREVLRPQWQAILMDTWSRHMSAVISDLLIAVSPDKEVEGMAWAGGRVGSKGAHRVELWSRGLGRGRQVVCKEGGGKCVDIRGRSLGREPARMDGRMRPPGWRTHLISLYPNSI